MKPEQIKDDDELSFVCELVDDVHFLEFKRRWKID